MILQLLLPAHQQQIPTSPSAKKYHLSIELTAETFSYYITYQMLHFDYKAKTSNLDEQVPGLNARSWSLNWMAQMCRVSWSYA